MSLSNLQIDITKKGGNHKPVGGPYSYEHIDQATGILVYFIKRIGETFPNWSEEMKLKGSSPEQHYPSQPARVSSYT